MSERSTISKPPIDRPDITQPVLAQSIGAVTGPVARALAEECAVAMVYNGSTQAVMMATPADLSDFAIGFSLTEGIITTPADITDLQIEPRDNGIEAQMWLSETKSEALTSRRRFMAGPVGCGLCGIDSLDQATRPLPPVQSNLRLPQALVLAATDHLRDRQPLHDSSRAAHAAGFLTPDGAMIAREDVGRHNALDKVIGALIREGRTGADGAMVLTSRISVEMVQKTAMAGCSIIIAASAPTAHALRIAQTCGITLVANARQSSAHIHTHPQRIT